MSSSRSRVPVGTRALGRSHGSRHVGDGEQARAPIAEGLSSPASLLPRGGRACAATFGIEPLRGRFAGLIPVREITYGGCVSHLSQIAVVVDKLVTGPRVRGAQATLLWKPTAAWSASNSTTSRSDECVTKASCGGEAARVPAGPERTGHQMAAAHRRRRASRWLRGRVGEPTRPWCSSALSRRTSAASIRTSGSVCRSEVDGGFDSPKTCNVLAGLACRAVISKNVPAPGPPLGSSRTPTPGTAAPSRYSPTVLEHPASVMGSSSPLRPRRSHRERNSVGCSPCHNRSINHRLGP